MSKGYTVAPWRLKPGLGQSLAVSSGSASKFTNNFGADGQTRAVYVSLAPTTTATGCLIEVSHAGATTATATSGLLVKTTDPPLLLMVTPGDNISAYGLAACTLYVDELTQ